MLFHMFSLSASDKVSKSSINFHHIISKSMCKAYFPARSFSLEHRIWMRAQLFMCKVIMIMEYISCNKLISLLAGYDTSNQDLNFYFAHTGAT